MAQATSNLQESPNIENLPQHLAKLKLPVYHINSEHWVDIMHVNNPHSFYARPTMFRRYMEFIEAKGDSISKSDVKIMMILIFYSEEIKRNVRGQIIFVNEEKSTCSINAIDYGFIEPAVSFDNIYYPCQNLKLCPLAVHCQLKDCKPSEKKGWDAEVTETMRYFVDGERAKLTIKGILNGKYLVEIRNSAPDDIATLLAYVGTSCFGYAHETYNRIDVAHPKKRFFTNKELKVGDTLHVKSLYLKSKSLSAFYVAEVKDYKVYIEERASFNMFSKQCQKLTQEDLKEGMPVSVFIISDNKYERAIIKKVTDPNEKAIVHLIDTGNSQELSLSSMRQMSDKFFERPPVAIYCIAQENQRFDYRLEKFLYPGYEFMITVKEIGNMFDKPNVVQILPKSVV